MSPYSSVESLGIGQYSRAERVLRGPRPSDGPIRGAMSRSPSSCGSTKHEYGLTRRRTPPVGAAPTGEQAHWPPCDFRTSPSAQARSEMAGLVPPDDASGALADTAA